MCMYIYMISSTCSYTHMYNHIYMKQYQAKHVKEIHTKILVIQLKKVSTIQYMYMYINQKSWRFTAFVINTIYDTSFTNK